MDEARRFLRYVTPGLVFAIEVTILFWVLRPDWVEDKLPKLFGRDSGVAFVFAGLLASGGLGIFFSAIHHGWHWRRKGTIIDHTALLKRLIQEGVLELRGVDLSVLSGEEARKRAWIIVTALWFQRREGRQNHDQIKGAEPRVSALYDLVHSLGANRIATAAAGLFAFSIAAAYSKLDLSLRPVLFFIGALALACGAFYIFHTSYRRVGKMAQAVTDQVLSDALVAERNTTQPVVTWPHISDATRGTRHEPPG